MRAPRIPDSAARLLTGPAVGALSARAIGMAGALAMSVAILRSLSKPDAGMVVLIYSLVTLTAMLARFGSDNLALVLVSQDRTRAPDVVRHTVQLTALISVPSMLVMVILVLVHGSHGA